MLVQTTTAESLEDTAFVTPEGRPVGLTQGRNAFGIGHHVQTAQLLGHRSIDAAIRAGCVRVTGVTMTPDGDMQANLTIPTAGITTEQRSTLARLLKGIDVLFVEATYYDEIRYRGAADLDTAVAACID